MNTERGNKIVTNFVQRVGKIPGLKILRIAAISKNVFEVSGSHNCFLYIKARAEYPLRWGVTANVLHRLKQHSKPWFVILLFESSDKGYILSASDVECYITNVWALGRDGDYKPATGRYLSKNIPFHSFDELFSQLSSEINKPFSIGAAIEKAKSEAVSIYKRGGGESITHKQLKNYVANNPSSIGLKSVMAVSVEHLFPSGDKVDIAFELENSNWTVVEIEIEGLLQTLIGLFQSVKYRALQEAVIKSQNIHGNVVGMLVAKSIPSEIKSLADVLSIKTVEITI
ncbi:MAG: hypothetical protein WA240_05425 [Nitrospirota bacterium]